MMIIFMITIMRSKWKEEIYIKRIFGTFNYNNNVKPRN